MSAAPPPSIPMRPLLAPSEDFYRLRREGIGFLEQMASQLWTDYNTHDPGITILEALCYAITDLAYRLRWDIKDILAPETPAPDLSQPYPGQAFFTARNILTVNPATPDDFRRLLIDLKEIRNAWVFCKECACGLSYYAWCDVENQLQLSYQAPPEAANIEPKRVSPLGLYEVLIELEADPVLGDLNDRKVERTIVMQDAAGTHQVIMEMRFPDMSLSGGDLWARFLGGEAFSASMTRLGATKDFDVFTDSSLKTDADRDTYIRRHWRDVLYLTFEIVFTSSSDKITIENAALRLFGDNAAKNLTTAASLKDRLLESASGGGFIQLYGKKARSTEAAMSSAKGALLSHRNLDEDYCVVETVGIEEVAVCADVEVAAGADIDYVQARIWIEIENYFNPPIPFQSLQEMMDSGTAVEDVFNGPALGNGFIRQDDLDAAALKTVLRVSDIINKLMDIEGVMSVNQLMLTKYDSEGNVVRGAADPTWGPGGTPIFDVTKSSASWLLYMGSRRLPRLYRNLSRFLFYKNELPFMARMDEANDICNQLRGQQERAKIGGGVVDLNIPKGDFREPEEYFPVQYSLPMVYGTGPAGLPSNASIARQAQARQLKAYLMVFEQILGNAFAQLAHAADLFSLDPSLTRTYFVKEFSESLVVGFADLKEALLNKATVERMVETEAEFHERRNTFLDHLMARFGEDFNEYALLLADAQGRQVALERLTGVKISFLQAFPQVSHDRAKAMNYSRPAQPQGAQSNQAGIKSRVRLLLGDLNLTFNWTVSNLGSNKYQLDFKLTPDIGTDWLEGQITLDAATADAAMLLAYRTAVEQTTIPDSYQIAPESGKYRLVVMNGAVPLGRSPGLFETQGEASATRDRLLNWSANERMLVVEHLLLRPKFPGDALFPACSEGGCTTCGDEDPYSFRLTVVMPGWTAAFTDNLDMRRFAERTIQQEIPSHLLGKICWVGNDGLVENPCDEVVGELAARLIAAASSAGHAAPDDVAACNCANAIYHAFFAVFEKWFEGRELDYVQPDALSAQVEVLFGTSPDRASINCGSVTFAPVWGDVKKLMVGHFQQLARYGQQFERFENAWNTWLQANAAFDWTEERLHDRVEAMLRAGADAGAANDNALCKCAEGIITAYGMHFYDWMKSNLSQGIAFKDFPPFKPNQVNLCPDVSFKPGTEKTIQGLLDGRYAAYTEVSYRLHVLVNLLSELRNTYPAATLHDCDEAGDRNPVRLGSTALGNYPLNTTAS